MRRAFVTSLVVAAVGCSSARYGASETGAPSITLPAHFGEGHTGKAEDAGGASMPPSPDAGSPRAAGVTSPSPRGPTALPDPDPPLKTAAQWEYQLEYAKGNIRVASIRSIELNRPVLTARHLGRFAFELWIGAELVERVRFDFPLLAADPPPVRVKRPLHDPSRFGPGAETSQRIMVPASDRATAAVIVDRLTGARTSVPWPPAAAPNTPNTPNTPNATHEAAAKTATPP